MTPCGTHRHTHYIFRQTVVKLDDKQFLYLLTFIYDKMDWNSATFHLFFAYSLVTRVFVQHKQAPVTQPQSVIKGALWLVQVILSPRRHCSFPAFCHLKTSTSKHYSYNVQSTNSAYHKEIHGQGKIKQNLLCDLFNDKKVRANQIASTKTLSLPTSSSELVVLQENIFLIYFPVLKSFICRSGEKVLVIPRHNGRFVFLVNKNKDFIQGICCWWPVKIS